MTISRPRCPPAPPAGFHAELSTTQVLPNPEPWVRVFWDGRPPLAFSRSETGNRFDPLAPPWDNTEVLYAGTSLETAVAETLLRWHGQITPGERVILSEAAQLRGRRVARFMPKRPLTVIDATGLGLAAIESVIAAATNQPGQGSIIGGVKALAEDIFQCNASDYPLTQQWGAWFRSQCPDADGLMWVSRQFNVGRCMVMFGDRCGNLFDLAAEPVPLYAIGSPERAVVDRMLAQLRWGVEA